MLWSLWVESVLNYIERHSCVWSVVSVTMYSSCHTTEPRGIWNEHVVTTSWQRKQGYRAGEGRLERWLFFSCKGRLLALQINAHTA